MTDLDLKQRAVVKVNGEGLPRSAVLKELKMRLSVDLTHDSGRILGSMCCRPHSLAKQVYMQNLEKNLGDPGLYPGTLELEQEAVQMLGALLSNPQACGHIVSGGTEANILAMWAARNLSGKKRCEIILSPSAHFSFNKIADLLGMRLVKARVNERFQVDARSVEKAITPRTVAIVGIAGTTDLGVVDPIAELSEVALRHGLYLHVDAAFGGFVLPFLKNLGFDAPDFDFRFPGVCSVTIDPHKMGLAPIPAGGILLREESMMKAISTSVSYLAGGAVEQSTVLGTRSGASAVATWALLKYLGWKGYSRVIKHCMALTGKLAEGVQSIDGLSLMVEPVMNMVAIKSDMVDVSSVALELRRRGWAVSLFPSHIRIIVTPTIKSSHIENFLEDLRKTMIKLSG